MKNLLRGAAMKNLLGGAAMKNLLRGAAMKNLLRGDLADSARDPSAQSNRNSSDAESLMMVISVFSA